jgi:hypothetical protein
VNCKPGDLAVLVRTLPEFPEQVGRVFRVTALDPAARRGHAWFYEGTVIRTFRPMHTWISLPDEWLRPIRPGDISDEEVRDLYAPNILEAA